MRENGYCFSHLNVLLALLKNDVRKGAFIELIEQSGSEYKQEFYTSREWLLNEGIIVPDGETTIRQGNGEKAVTNYKVKRDVILSILCAEWETKILYHDFVHNRISFIPTIKPRKEKK